MTLDLGGRRRRRPLTEKAVIAVGAAAVAAFALWLFGGSFLREREAAITLAREWAIDGPPCPALTPAEARAQGLEAPKGLHYQGVEFYRRSGHMSCSPIRYGMGRGFGAYAVCQFTSPGVLRVVTRRGEWWFAPGLGQPATVATPRGEARCVMASNFRLR